MLSLNPAAARFLDKNPIFQELHGTLDNLFRRLHDGGAGWQVKYAEVITKQEDNELWESGELGIKHPKALQNAVFYYNGKSFCLRGGVEHRELKIKQLERTFEPNGYIYHEYVSKNQSGTYQQLHLQSKVVPIYACPDGGQRCHVFLLDLYLRKLPQEAILKDVFYVRPLQETPRDPSVPWYTAVPVGKHTLNNKVKVMCERAGIQGHKTNHSLRATAATELYQADVPEKLIQERTGHQSLKALRVYERTTTHQQQAVSSLPSTHNHASFQQHLTKVNQSHIDVRCPPAWPTINFSFQNLKDCTINIMQPQSKLTEQLPLLSDAELDQILGDAADTLPELQLL